MVVQSFSFCNHFFHDTYKVQTFINTCTHPCFDLALLLHIFIVSVWTSLIFSTKLLYVLAHNSKLHENCTYVHAKHTYSE